MKGLNFIVSLQIYPYEIMFSVGQIDKDFLKCCYDRLPYKDYEDLVGDSICSLSPETRGRTFHHLEGGQTIVRLPKRPVLPSEIGTAAHEIFHAVEYIFGRIGLQHTDASSEAWAYTIGYITEQFFINLK